MRIITANLNGIRAANRKGFYPWLAEVKADIVCLQETKAQMAVLSDEVFRPAGYHCYFADAIKKGYSGVGIYTREKPQRIITQLDFPASDQEGRYCQVDFAALSVISLYLPSGSSGEVRQAVKYSCLDFFKQHLVALKRRRRDVIVCGDLNIAHTKKDIKNWRGNQKNSGFLPEERAWLSHLFDEVGYVDAFREVNQDDEQYTWWSNRGQAYANNVGWRIDYQVVTPGLRDKIQRAEIFTQQRFSDHAPLIMDYSL
jgi:exodeoxyribonuclease III